jgi:hypothetical protein
MAERQYNFVVFGGLTKPYYDRFRQLREKYGLKDRGMIECLIASLLEGFQAHSTNEATFRALVDTYKVTAPVDQAPLPEVR